jgi:hypothetical protein
MQAWRYAAAHLRFKISDLRWRKPLPGAISF